MDEYSLARWRTTFPFSITFWCCNSVMGLLAAVRGNNSHYATPRATQFALYVLCLPPMATLLARICAQRWAFFSSDERARELFGRAFLIIYLLRDVTYILDPSTPTISPITLMSLCLVRFTWQLLLPTMAIPQAWCGLVAIAQVSAVAFAPMHVTDLIGTEACDAANPVRFDPRPPFSCAIVFGFFLGLLIELRARARHIARPASPPTAADDDAESKLGMHPVTLRFASAEEERAFAIEFWTGSYRTALVIIFVYVGLGATTHIVDPGQPSASLMVVGAGVIFVMRVWLARLADAERARALFAGLVTFGTAVPCSLIVALRAAGVVAVIGLPPESRAVIGDQRMHDGWVLLFSFTFLIVAACLPAMGLRFEQRIVYVVAVTVTAAFDAVGGETHQVMLCGATLFGLMLGHQWETTRRLQHVLLRQQALHVRAVDSRVAEAESRAASYKEALAKGDLEKLLLEEEAERERRMAHADRRLNHVIKGSVGAALTSVEIAELLLAEGRPAADLKLQLASVRTSLQSAISWVSTRQFFINLEEGSYTTVATAVDITATLEAATGAKGATVRVAADAKALSIDDKVLGVVLAEAVSNARKYGDAAVPIALVAEWLPTGGGERGIPVLSLTVTSTNPPGADVLSRLQLQRAFEPGFRAHSASDSTGVGLDTVAKAVSAVGGAVWLTTSAAATGRVATNFHARLPATPLPPGAVAAARVAEGVAARPTTPPPPPSSGAAGPGAAVDVGEFWDSDDSGVVRRPIVVGIDDDPMCRAVLDGLIEHVLHADMTRSGSIGETAEERNAFVDVAMGRLDLQLRPTAEGARFEADVALLDQNIGPGVFGTEIAAALRARGFRGVTCVITGSSPDDVGRLGALPAVDLCVEKGAQVAAALPNLLRRAAASKLASASPRWTPENPPPPPPPPGSSWTADNPASPSPNIGGDAPIGVSPEEWRLLHLTKAQLEAEAAGRAWR